MKKYKYLLLSLLISLLIPSTIYAECTEEDLQDFKEKEKEFTIKYEFDKETKMYTITMNYPDSEKYVYGSNDKDFISSKCEVIDKKTVKCEQVKPNEYTFAIIGKSESCKDVLKNITISLPQYNNYSEDPLCAGLEEFYLCQPTYDKVVDYDTFVSRVKLYKEKQEAKKKNVVQKEETPEESKIAKYIKDNLIQIIVLTVFVIMIVITIVLTVKAAKQSRRLEWEKKYLKDC